jgi:hypothetical protein
MLRIFATVLALFVSSLNADVTIRYKSEVKSSLPAMIPNTALANIQPDTTLRIKGSKSYNEIGRASFISDTAGKELILVDTAGKKYASTTMDEYLRALDSAVSIHERAKSTLAAFKSKGADSKATGRTATIQGIEAEERQIEWSLEGPAMPNMPLGSIRFVMQIWVSKESEAARVPALRELAAYNQSALSAVGGIKKFQDMLPGWGDLASLMHDVAKSNSVMLRRHIDLFMPALAADMKQMPAGNNPLGGSFDPNGPLIQINEDMVEFSTAPVPDSQFQVPEQYQRESVEEFVKSQLSGVMPAAK